MNNIKIINKNNLINNLCIVKNKFNNICVMVKADAYGHNLKAVLSILKNRFIWFGVANENEAISVKKYASESRVLIVGKIKNFEKVINKNISFTIDSIQEIQKVISICKNKQKVACVHIAVNSGMNRIGVKSLDTFTKILSLINNNSEYVKVEGVFTHCFDADSKGTHFYEQMKIFHKYVSLIQDKKVIIHIGGSFVLKHKIPNFVNMVRVGYFIYGYGLAKLKPVMKIESRIVNITDCKKGEYIGYGNKTKILADCKIACVPIGYADGLCRRLSDKYCFKIGNKRAKIIGNICMDMCMIDVSQIDCKLGNRVVCLESALSQAKIVDTSPYEILTNYSKLRGKTIVE